MSDNVFTHTDERASEKPVAPKVVVKDTPLSALSEKLSKRVRRPFVDLPIPEREGVALIIDPNISAKEELKAWRRIAGEGTKKDFDIAKFATVVIAAKTVGISVNGVEQFDSNGYPVSFTSPEILEMLNKDDDGYPLMDPEDFLPYPDAVKAMFGLDPHVQAAAEAILSAAGYGDDIETTSNPTTNS